MQSSNAIDIHIIKHCAYDKLTALSYSEAQLTHYSKMLLNDIYCAIFWKPKTINDDSLYYLFTRSPRGGQEILQVTTCMQSRPVQQVEYCLNIPNGYVITEIDKALKDISGIKFQYLNAEQNKEIVTRLFYEHLSTAEDIELLCCKNLSQEVESRLSIEFGIRLS